MTGYIPDGDTVAALLRQHTMTDRPEFEYLKGGSRLDDNVRDRYNFLLSKVFEKYEKMDGKASYRPLTPSTRDYVEHALIESLRCRDQDHLLVATQTNFIEDFFKEVQEKYGFRQSDPDIPKRPSLKLENSRGELLKLPEPEQVFAVAAEAFLREYVTIVCEPEVHAWHYFERSGFRTY